MALRVLLKAEKRVNRLRALRFRPFIAVLTGKFRSEEEKKAVLYVCKYFLDNWMHTFVEGASILAEALREVGVQEEVPEVDF